MKNFLIYICFLSFLTLNGQTTIYYENFDLPTILGTSNCSTAWSIDNTLFVSSANSYKGDIITNDTTCFTTDPFSTMGNSNVILSFNHICKIEFFDYGIIQVTTDGINWIDLSDNEYTGAGIFGAGGNKFSAVTYTDWNAFDNTAIPQNSWFKNETFDISSLVANETFVQVRFLLFDGNGSGAQSNYGWVIDNIQVIASLSELDSPTINLVSPVLLDDVTGVGPFTVSADIQDNSGIDTAMIIYSIDNSSLDTVPMIDSSGVYYGELPEGYYGDIYCYTVLAIDASPAANIGYYPEIDSCISFTSIPLPPSITLGDNNLTNTQSTYPTPYGNNYWGSRHQFLINASELQDLGIIGTEILSLAFDVVQISGVPLEDYTISIGHSIQNDLNSWETGLTTVFFDPAYIETPGTNEHYFQSPFFWNGIDNIVVETCFNNQSSFLNAVVSQTQQSFTASRWYNANATGVCNSTTFNGGVSNNRPNMKIRFPVPNDIDLIHVINPNAIGCDFSIVEQVSVLYKNVGTDPQDSLILSYTLNGGITILDTLVTLLEPNDSLFYTFSTPIDLSAAGQNILAFITAVQVEGNIIYTDTLVPYSINNNFQVASYLEDFETFTTNNLSNGWTHDNINATFTWSFNQGSTSSSNTGPTGDHTSGTGNYFYTEASNNTNETAILVSPCIDISQLYQPQISFWYHMYGSSMGSLSIEILDDNGNWLEVWYLQGDQGNDWYQAVCDISTFLSQQIIKFRVVGNTGPSFYSDIAIDDFLVSDPLDEDVGVTAIIAPSENSCGLGNEVVTVEVVNFGTSIQDTIPLSYSLNGGAVVNELFLTTLFPQDTAYFSFSTLVDMSVLYQNYVLSSWTELVNDQSNFNDSTNNIQFINAVISGIGGENFDSFNPGTGSLADPGNLTNGWIRNPDPLVGQTGFTWMVNSSSTASTNTGPMGDNTNSCGIYLYTESSNGVLDDEAVILSPCIDATLHVNTQMEFYYHMYGATIGKLYIDVFDGLNWINSVDSIVGQQQNTSTDSWLLKQVSLTQFSGNEIRIRFRALRGSSYTGDIAIDDFYVYDQIAYDAAIVDFLSPMIFATSGANSNIEVLIKNYGTTPLTSFDISYDDGSSIVTENWVGNLSPGSTTTYTFTTPLTAINGPFTLCSYTSLINDGQPLNDEACVNIVGLPVEYLPHVNDFETTPSDWVSNNICYQEWEYGTPSGAMINTVNSGTSAWVTNLEGNYGDNVNDYLYTPFFDFSNAFDAELKFWHIYDFPTTGDGARIDYSVDGGQTWQVVGAAFQLNATNWYNSVSITTTGLPGWSGSSLIQGGWHQSTIILDWLNQISTPVQFRFNIASNDFTNNYDGWAIDDFEIDVPISHSAASVSTYPGVNANFILPMANDVHATIENTGAVDLSSFSISLEINGNFIVTDNVILTTPILTGQTVNHTFSQQWQSPTGIHTICVWTSSPNGILDGYPWDDTTCVQVTVFDSTSVYPYCNTFDGTILDPWVTLNSFTYDLNSTWEIGAPSQVVLGIAHSQPNAWMTGLNVDYVDKDSSALYTPVFDVQADTCYDISFMHKYFTEEHEDGGIVEYTQDGGYTWLQVGFAFEPNWYDSEYVTGLGGPPAPPGWSGTSNGWQVARHRLKFPNNGSTIFRLRFGSDMSIQSEGWVIDDFCLSKVGECNISYTGIGINEIKPTDIVLNEFTPNPTNSIAILDVVTHKESKLKCKVINVLGELVFEDNLSTVIGRNKLHLNVENWYAGLYYVVFEFEGRMYTKKLMVVK